MSLTMHRILALAVFMASFSGVTLSADENQKGIEFFENKIRPVLVEHCYQCHAADAKKIRGGLVLDTRDGLLTGGDSGPAIVPENVKRSLLISALRHEDLEMPPKSKLPDGVIQDFEDWVKMGAPDPRSSDSQVVQEAIDIESGREFWSFQPVRTPVVPELSDSSQSLSDVDHFILDELEKRNLQPSEPADAQTIQRRIHFDLTGLPPDPDELQPFKDAYQANPQAAVEHLVNRLLDSPQFGERWGRHWLDVARYAESNGNSRNALFPNAWRYRDYVIDAFNDDLPYDQFIIEQLAGDLLSHDDIDQENRHLIATGFLALGSKPVIKGKNNGFVADIVSDQIEVTTRSMLGITVSCARCHDHKFDPIPTTDYYAIAGIFASSETLYGGGNGGMGGAPVTPLHQLVSENRSEVAAYQSWQKEIAQLKKQQQEIGNQLKKLRPNKKSGAKASPEQKKELAELANKQRELADSMKTLQTKKVPRPDEAMGIREAGKIVEVPIHIRGENPKGNGIPRGFVSVATNDHEIRLPKDQSGRLEFARWVASADNPLTARVMVNRIWLHLFGQGLVRTPDNFGFNGQRPENQPLLDYLAAKFVADDWSVKKMIRRLMTTQAYQCSSEHNDQNFEIDPDNVYFWRHARRRLSAEEIRDSMLSASGQLKLDRPVGSIVQQYGSQLIQDKLTPDKIHEPSRHRSIYLPILRNGLPEMLEVFDLAEPSLVVGQRNVTTVPAQDLYLMNSEFVYGQSRQFAQLVLTTAESDEQRCKLVYRRALSRNPTSQEIERGLSFLHAAQQNADDGESDAEQVIDAWTSFCQTLFLCSEFRYLE
jgi:hypothetical protein